MKKTFYIIFRIRTSIGAELKIARLVLKDALDFSPLLSSLSSWLRQFNVGGLKPASPKKNRMMPESVCFDEFFIIKKKRNLRSAFIH